MYHMLFIILLKKIVNSKLNRLAVHPIISRLEIGHFSYKI
jgi:hypothetical protein